MSMNGALRGAGATRAAGLDAPVAQTVRGQQVAFFYKNYMNTSNVVRFQLFSSNLAQI
jgi:hypothetical protein